MDRLGHCKTLPSGKMNKKIEQLIMKMMKKANRTIDKGIPFIV
jgi:hypothetical protein